MLTLIISHKIFLNREERYSLFNGKTLDVIGCCIPVWLLKNATSEPSQEIFCKYRLINQKENSPIKMIEDGFEIVLAKKRIGKKPKISQERWRKLTWLEHMKFYDSFPVCISPKSLLDVSDGGNGCMVYKEQNKIKQDGKNLIITHYVEISEIQELMDSLS